MSRQCGDCITPGACGVMGECGKRRRRCSEFRRYKALRPPTCGCIACDAKWQCALYRKTHCLPTPIVAQVARVCAAGDAKRKAARAKPLSKYTLGLVARLRRMSRNIGGQFRIDPVKLAAFDAAYKPRVRVKLPPHSRTKVAPNKKRYSRKGKGSARS